jgi:hypothetical protein
VRGQGHFRSEVRVRALPAEPGGWYRPGGWPRGWYRPGGWPRGWYRPGGWPRGWYGPGGAAGRPGGSSRLTGLTGRPGITGHNPRPGAGPAQPRRWSIAVVTTTTMLHRRGSAGLPPGARTRSGASRAPPAPRPRYSHRKAALAPHRADIRTRVGDARPVPGAPCAPPGAAHSAGI